MQKLVIPVANVMPMIIFMYAYASLTYGIVASRACYYYYEQSNKWLFNNMSAGYWIDCCVVVNTLYMEPRRGRKRMTNRLLFTDETLSRFWHCSRLIKTFDSRTNGFAPGRVSIIEVRV